MEILHYLQLRTNEGDAVKACSGTNGQLIEVSRGLNTVLGQRLLRPPTVVTGNVLSED